MATLTRKWKRLLAVGCSHGAALRPDARDAVLSMRERWRPDAAIHLGDWCDTTAFRGGAKGTPDEGAPVGPDIDAGLAFLRDIGATIVLAGNHEDRFLRLRSSPNAIIAECATYTAQRIADRLALQGAEWVAEWPSWRVLGGVKFGHGSFYNEMYLRDSAEAFGPCVVAHGHRAGVATGRRDDSPQCYGVGTLAGRDADEMGYAKSRRATLAWSGGFVWGEYTDDAAQLWLHDNGQSTEWRLPV